MPFCDTSTKPYGIIYDFEMHNNIKRSYDEFEKILEKHKDKCEFFLLTMIDEQVFFWGDKVKEHKFEEIHAFNNPNTDNDVHIYMRIN